MDCAARRSWPPCSTPSFLLVSVGAIGWESVLRLMHPEPVAGITVMIVAGIGIVINAATALMFAGGRKTDINVEGAFLHMAADAAVSLGVVIAAGLILWTGWTWIDPVMSLVICLVILWSTWGLLRSSVSMSLNAVPPGVDVDAVRKASVGIAGRDRRCMTCTSGRSAPPKPH